MADPTLAFGRTRTRIGRRHAFLAPDGHVPETPPGWSGSEAVTLISPQMGGGVGARFTMALLRLAAGARIPPAAPGVERFLHVLDGALEVVGEGRHERLEAGGYLFLPAGSDRAVRSDLPARAVAFQRRYLPLAEAPPPEVVIGRLQEAPAEPFLGDEAVQVRRLLPGTPSFDMAVNVMSFRPGASLPLAETHPNEHGLLMLSGGGVYRLEDDWYPITAGDALWMAPYCPQWFGALGRVDGSYLLYKDQGRDWLAAAEHTAP